MMQKQGQNDSSILRIAIDQPPTCNDNHIHSDNGDNGDNDDNNDRDVDHDEDSLLSTRIDAADEDDILNTRKVLSPGLAHKLYLSHWLSTWNARTYEFAVVSVA